MNKPTLWRAMLLSSSVALLLAACGASDKYYRLASDGAAPVRATGISVGLGPVALPGYIDRAELVFQDGANQFQVPPSARWTGTLQENVLNALREDVGRRLDTGNVLTYPFPPGVTIRYQVAIDVREFHAISGGNAILECSWRIVDPDGGRVISRHNGSYQEPISGNGYDSVVAAESRLLAQLADGIAQSLRRR